MGSDGSAGLRAIKEKNGIVLVQDPAQRKIRQHATQCDHSVLADIIAPANLAAWKAPGIP